MLVDYKGGAAFGPCARLPHTVGMVTDLDGSLVERALASLHAELARREAVLAAVGAKDVEDHRRLVGRRRPAPVLPRLVIVVDEFASLVEELPDFVGGLVGIAMRGRSPRRAPGAGDPAPRGRRLARHPRQHQPAAVPGRHPRHRVARRHRLAAGRDHQPDDAGSRLRPHRPRRPDAVPGRPRRRASAARVARHEAPTVEVLPAAELGDPDPLRAAGAEAAATTTRPTSSLLVDACVAAAARLGLPPQPLAVAAAAAGRARPRRDRTGRRTRWPARPDASRRWRTASSTCRRSRPAGRSCSTSTGRPT